MMNKNPPNTLPNGPIIVFDAMCVLCSANAQFVLKFDKRRHFHLASMQEPVGNKLYIDNGIDPTNPDSIIIVDGDTTLKDSDAILAIYSHLGWPWKLAGTFKLVPKFLRDPIYLFIARNRYRIFGKRETCWVPTAEQKERVL